MVIFAKYNYKVTYIAQEKGCWIFNLALLDP